MKLKTHLTNSKLPYLTSEGIKFEVLKEKGDISYIEIEIDLYTLNSLFAAGEKKGLEDFNRWKETQQF